MTDQVASKAAILLPSLKFGGAERVALALARAFVRRGMDVDILLMSCQGELLADAQDAGRVVDLQCDRTYKLPWKLYRYLRQERPDFLLSSFWKLNLCACLATWLYGRNRLLLWEHSPPSKSVHSPSLLYALSASIAYRVATRVVAVSQGVAQDVRQLTCGLGARVVVIPNPVEPPPPETLPLVGRARGATHELLYVGRLDEPKNPALLLEAMSRLSPGFPVRLRVIGDGPLRHVLFERAKQLQVADRIEFFGYQKDPYPFMMNADMLVLPSNREGLPGVLVEALYSGLKIVATDCGEGVRGLLANGKLGRLVPVKDSSALALAIEVELKTPRDTEQGRQAVACHLPDAAAARFLQLLEQGEGCAGRQ